MAGADADFTFDSQTFPNPNDRIAAWQDSFSQTVEVHFSEQEVDDFSASAKYRRLGSVLLVERRYTSNTVIRNQDTVIRTGKEYLVFHYFLEGGIVGMVSGTRTDVMPGECFMYDMRGTMRIHMRSGHFIGLIIPTRIFEEALGGKGKLHGLVFRACSPQAFFLGQMLIAIAKQAEHLPADLKSTFGTALVSLLAASVKGLLEELGSVRPEVPSVSPEAAAVIAAHTRMQRHIDRNAADPAYRPDKLAAAFGLSRATLYRKFQFAGGVAGAIRARRAALARAALKRIKSKPVPLAAIAKASGFPSVAAMRRALHLHYGSSTVEVQLGSTDEPLMPRSHSLLIGALYDLTSKV